MGGIADAALRQMAFLEQQMGAQRAFVERTTPKGPLWFWEHISDPYVELTLGGLIMEAYRGAGSH